VSLSDRTGGWVGLHVLVADAFPNPLDCAVIRNLSGTVLRAESPDIDQRSDGYIERTLSRGADPRCDAAYVRAMAISDLWLTFALHESGRSSCRCAAGQHEADEKRCSRPSAAAWG